MKHIKLISLLVIVCAFTIGVNVSAQLEPSFSISNDFLPYQDIDEPIVLPDSSIVNDAQVQLSKFKTTFTYPMMLSQGKTILFNEFSYQQIKFKYKKTTSLLDKLHSFSYTLTALHFYSEKWSLLAMGKSSLASDLEVDIAMEDFSFQTAVILNRQYSQNFSLGLGLTFSTQFGNGEFFPLLSFDWNNGENWSAKGILPANLEVWYKASEKLNIGLLVTGDGENFRFDPGSYGNVHPEPNLRYTMMTIGGITKVNLSKSTIVSIEAGIIGLHRFEFYSGDDEVVSNDLEPSQYVRLGIQSNL